MTPVEELVGRDDDLRVVAAALAVAEGPTAVLVEGEMGIGKTAFWRRALADAAQRRALSCRPGGADVRLSFAALADLLEPAVDEALGALPGPQRRALEVALLRREPGPLPPDGRAIGTAVLGVLRRLAAERPLLVAVDDVQWLDEPSAAALRFALRRLGDAPIAVLAARRLEPGAGHPLELAGALPPARLLRLRLRPLAAGALAALLRERLGLELSPPTLARLHRATGGNAFFALEIGRELSARGQEPAAGEPLPIPDDVRELVGRRLARLSAPARETLVAAAALARPRLDVLRRARPDAEEALEEAIRAGVVSVAGRRLDFSHPLLASVAYADAPPGQRRRTHAALAEAVEDLEERAGHLALAAAGPDADVAAALDAAAAAARARGAPEAAAELHERAAALTPAGDAEPRHGRVLAAAECLFQAGRLDRAEALLGPAADAAPSATARAEALLLGGAVAGEVRGTHAAAALLERALQEQDAAPRVRAELEQRLAWNCLVSEHSAAAELHARAALALAETLPAHAPRAVAAATAALVRFVRGGGIDGALLDRGLALERRAVEAGEWTWVDERPSTIRAVLALWSGELDAARPLLEELLQATGESGDDVSRAVLLGYLGPLESRAGNLRRAAVLGAEQLQIARETGQEPLRAGALFAVGLAAAGLGETSRARESALEGLRLAEHTGHGYYALANRAVLGGLELSLGDFAAAVRDLAGAHAQLDALGIEPPGIFPVRADLVEALVGAGEPERAAPVAAVLEDKARTLPAAWLRATAARARGLVAEARGDRDGALAAFDGALAAHEGDGRPLERARTLLALGAARRRARAKRAAREALEQALAAFEDAGAALWARRARDEIARIGGRSAAPAGRLTPAEAAVAELVRTGRTNREVAAALHLSERTVEWNLSRVYAKLGVRSRTQLAALDLGAKSGDSHG